MEFKDKLKIVLSSYERKLIASKLGIHVYTFNYKIKDLDKFTLREVNIIESMFSEAKELPIK